MSCLIPACSGPEPAVCVRCNSKILGGWLARLMLVVGQIQNMKIRRATMEDLHGINAMHRESILGLCAVHYSAVELSQWTDALRPDKYITLFAGREVFIAEEDGKILGFAVLDLRESLINMTLPVV